MVRLINDKNLGLIKKGVAGFMHCQEPFTHILEINNKELKPCIYALWHADQFCIYGIQDKANLSVLISNSIDGEIVAYAVESMGFKTVRGSSGKKGSVESTLQMIERLNNKESIALMVDGPSGPLHKVKNGAIKLAQKTGAPIVPMHWYCDQWNFIKLPSWDKMTTPIGDCKILNLYGEPIYVSPDASDEEITEAKNKVKESLDDLEKRIPEVYKEARKQKLWSKKK